MVCRSDQGIWYGLLFVGNLVSGGFYLPQIVLLISWNYFTYFSLGKISDTHKANPNYLNISLTKDTKWKQYKKLCTYVHMYLENNHRKINTLEEIEILKATSSKYLLNDVIAGQNDPHISDLNSKQHTKFWKPTITIITDRNFNTHNTCRKCCINNERPTGKKHTNVGWVEGGKIGKIIN